MSNESVISPPVSRAGAGGPVGLPARGLLKERAYDELKRMLLSEELAPGTFLAERQLAARLGMSKTPVRSALERLEAEGFISIAPQQGAVVREVAVQEIADQYEIRTALETYVARTLAGHLTAEQTDRVQANLEAQRENLATGDVERGVALDEEFHSLLGTYLGNGEIQRVMGQLRDKIHRVISRVFQLNPGRMAASYEEHRAIFDAIRAGDAEQAARRVELHLRVGKDALLAPRLAH